MLNNFKLYRRYKGGYWIKYDMNSYMSSSSPQWVQATKQEYEETLKAKEAGSFIALRCVGFENYM